MIVREVVYYTDIEFAKFDYFNDYKDTRSWLVMKDYMYLVAVLDKYNRAYIIERNREINLMKGT